MHNDSDNEDDENVHKFSDHPDKNPDQMMQGDDGLVAPDDETYNIYN